MLFGKPHFRKLATIVLLALILLWQLPQPASAVNEALDLPFGNAGRVITDLFGGVDVARAVAIQMDGKIIAAGETDATFGLTRYNPDGTLDTSFGNQGRVTTSFTNGYTTAYDVAVQADGKIVAVGETMSNFAIARYNTDGTLDGGFGTGGLVTRDFGSIDVANALAIQGDGKIIVVGSTFNGGLGNDFVIIRYNPNGTLDGGFGTSGGFTIHDFAGGGDVANDVAIATGGGIIVGGTAVIAANQDFALLGLDANGVPDGSFGAGGEVTTDMFGGADFANSLALLSSGNIILGGHATTSGRTDFAMAGYTANGTLNTAGFGTAGKVSTSFFDQSSEGFDLATHGADKIVLAGKASPVGGGEDFAIAQYNANGGLDVSFANGGQATTDFGGLERAFAVTVQPDSKIVAAGVRSFVGAPPPDFALARYLNFPLPDSIGVYRPETQTFYLRDVLLPGVADVQVPYGAAGDIPIVGDWDANATTTIGVYRPSNQTFFLRNFNTIGIANLQIPYGAMGDVPIVGDWDGDGDVTIGVYRPSNQTFYLRNSNSIGDADLAIPYGAAGDIPIVGDWDGDGDWTIGVYRPSNNTFYLRNSNSIGIADLEIPYGAMGDIPIVGDWDGDGTTTIGVHRAPSLFLLRNSNTLGFPDFTIPFGASGDLPLAGDWDGLP